MSLLPKSGNISEAKKRRKIRKNTITIPSSRENAGQTLYMVARQFSTRRFRTAYTYPHKKNILQLVLITTPAPTNRSRKKCLRFRNGSHRLRLHLNYNGSGFKVFGNGSGAEESFLCFLLPFL